MAESKKFDGPWTFLTTLGGSVSVYCGLSFVSILELAETVAKLLYKYLN